MSALAHDRRTFLTFAAITPVVSATEATADTPGSITIPIGPFAECERPGQNTRREKSEQVIDGRKVKIEVSYVCKNMTTITLFKPD